MRTREETVTIAVFDAADFCDCPDFNCPECCEVDTDCCVDVPITLYATFTSLDANCEVGSPIELTYSAGSWSGSGVFPCGDTWTVSLSCNLATCAPGTGAEGFLAHFEGCGLLGAPESFDECANAGSTCGPINLLFEIGVLPVANCDCCASNSAGYAIVITE